MTNDRRRVLSFRKQRLTANHANGMLLLLSSVAAATMLPLAGGLLLLLLLCLRQGLSAHTSYLKLSRGHPNPFFLHHHQHQHQHHCIGNSK
jgi:hypothetical protein